MSKNLFLIGLFLLSLLFQSCNSVISQNSKTEINSATPPQKDDFPKQQRVEFKGVSFTYNPQIFGEFKAEETAERPLEDGTHKPDYVAPQYILFKSKKPEQNREIVIYVSSIADYRQMYDAVPSRNHYAKQLDENLRGLQKVIKDKNYRIKGEIPFLPFYDAHQTFEAKVKHFSFGSGKGLFCLTQLNQDYAVVNNKHLTYFFQGISEDGKKYILGEFPVSVSFLPKDYHVGEFEGYRIPDYVYNDKLAQKKYEEYIAKITKRLENLPQNEFEPNLSYLEEIISSLKVEK